jgi:hypothetical protein
MFAATVGTAMFLPLLKDLGIRRSVSAAGFGAGKPTAGKLRLQRTF